jgi:hypothetical protein
MTEVWKCFLSGIIVVTENRYTTARTVLQTFYIPVVRIHFLLFLSLLFVLVLKKYCMYYSQYLNYGNSQDALLLMNALIKCGYLCTVDFIQL